MNTILLAKFQRALHNHDLYVHEFNIAYNAFVEEITIWQAEHGVKFDTQLVLLQDETFGPVSAVLAKFCTDSDFAMYKLLIDNHCIATTVDMSRSDQQNLWEFSGWTPVPHNKDLNLIENFLSENR